MGNLITGPGRIVWGHPMVEKPVNDNNGVQKISQKTGKPRTQWAFGVAFPKQDFITTVWPVLQAIQMQMYPAGPPRDFAWKYIDGDTVDKDGVPFAQREGYTGCFVLSVSTEAFCPPCFKFNPQRNAWDQMTEQMINCGDYVVLDADVQPNKPAPGTQNTPGLYINPVAIQHVGYGQVIVSRSAADPTKSFGAQPQQYALPAGASATPVAPQAAPGMPQQQPAPAPMGMPQQQPAPAPMGMQPQYPGGYAGQPGPAPQQPNMMPPAAAPHGYAAPAPAPMAAPAGYGMPQPGAPAMMPPPATGFAMGAPSGMPGAPAGMPAAPAPMAMPPGPMPGAAPMPQGYGQQPMGAPAGYGMPQPGR